MKLGGWKSNGGKDWVLSLNTYKIGYLPGLIRKIISIPNKGTANGEGG